MKKKILLATATAIVFSLFSCNKYKNMHGFKLIEKRFVKEVNADCYYFEHSKSGARLLKIAAPDPNKTFSIAFKTPPSTDNGIAHIMEHSVLNGSKNFPVKSPFDLLMKGSLNTFINAFTSKDRTMYPFASMNEKDYFNLMHIYMDAVFNPLLTTDDRILKQEGWHYELNSKDEPIIYKGVVYNEMKGAFSGPGRELRYQVFKNLFPETTYGCESGGYPGSIPSITNEDFIRFHQTYYHPENSYIVLYGDAELEKELEFINREYLSHYDQINKRPVIEDQKPLEFKKMTKYYPVLEGANTQNQTFLSMAWVTGSGIDKELTLALEIIDEVLFSQESAPVRLALQEAGIGQDVSVNIENYKQNMFQVTVNNANGSDLDRFQQLLVQTLQKEVKKGLDKETVQGILNRIEFRLREGDDAQKGLNYAFQAMPTWMHTNDPFTGIEYEKSLAGIKSKIENGYLENTIEKYLINNSHSVLVSLEPKPGLEAEIIAQTEEELARFKQSLTEEQLNKLIEETKKLIEFQNQQDSPEAVATIPMLEKSDINPKAPFYQANFTETSDVKILHYDEFTNNLVYVNLMYDIKVVPQELIPYVSLLSDVLKSLSTRNYSYADLNKQINLHTGGLSFFIRSLSDNGDDNQLISKFVVSAKSTREKTDKIFELSSEIVNQTLFTDTARLRTVLSKVQSRYESDVKTDGYSYAYTRFASYCSQRGAFDEITAGLEYYWFLSDLLKNYNQKSAEISANLQKVSSLLFSRRNMLAGLTCPASDFNIISKQVREFAGTLPNQENTAQNWVLKISAENEGILTPSKVQYVMQGYNYKELGYQFDGKMQVLRQILSTDWLQTQLRVLGGAYGGYCSISPNGLLVFSSYRDPNLDETLKNYANTKNYLENFKATDKEMTRYIIGTIAGMDSPLTPSQKGTSAYNAWLTHHSAEKAQAERNAVLSITAGDMNSYAEMIGKVTEKNRFCVYGNADKLNASAKLFKKLIKLDSN